jgi:hypothetical protein
MRLRGQALKNPNGPAGDIIINIETHLPRDIPDDIVQAIKLIKSK